TTTSKYSATPRTVPRPRGRSSVGDDDAGGGRAAEHLGRVDLFGRRRRDHELARRGGAGDVLVLVHAPAQPRGEGLDAVVAEVLVVEPAPPRPPAAAVVAGPVLSIDVEVGGRHGLAHVERRVDRLQAGRERVDEGDVVPHRVGHHRQAHAHAGPGSDAPRAVFVAGDVGWVVDRLVHAVDDEPLVAGVEHEV